MAVHPEFFCLPHLANNHDDLSEVMDLLAALQKNVIALSTMTDGTDYPDMHNT
jgi:hypothetical protein